MIQSLPEKEQDEKKIPSQVMARYLADKRGMGSALPDSAAGYTDRCTKRREMA
jgi:hypothetical protein